MYGYGYGEADVDYKYKWCCVLETRLVVLHVTPVSPMICVSLCMRTTAVSPESAEMGPVGIHKDVACLVCSCECETQKKARGTAIRLQVED